MNKKYPTRPKTKEPVYAEWDEEFQMWGVFGLNSGFCYSLEFTGKGGGSLYIVDATLPLWAV